MAEAIEAPRPKKYRLEGLDCPNCAAKLEAALQKVPGLSDASVSFSTLSVTLNPAFEDEAREIIRRVEPEVSLIDISARPRLQKYRLEGLDCPNCAAKLEAALQKAPGLSDASVSFSTLSVTLDPAFEDEAREIISRVEPEVSLVTQGDTSTHPDFHKHEAADDHDHEGHSHEHGGNSSQRLSLIKIAVAGAVFAYGMAFRESLHGGVSHLAEYLVFISAYLIVGWPVLNRALRNALRGEFFDENALMTIATAGAIAIHELPEAVAVMLFYSIGELFQDMAVERSRRSIASLMDVRPDYANLVEGENLRRVSPEAVHPGDIIKIRPGERVPLDGEVIEGSSYMDTSALTGESVPRKVIPGTTVLAGTVNTEGLITVRVTRDFAQSSVARILELVQDAAGRKSPTEKFISKFSRYYTPAVVAIAALVAVVPPLTIPGATFDEWVYRALILLVISCPCALVVSVPLGYFAGLGSASRAGVLIKGANYLDALTRVKMVIMDKTGTLTQGSFRVTEVKALPGFEQNDVLRWAAFAEVHSSHPIGRSILNAYQGDSGAADVSEYEDIKGHGIRATINGHKVLVGNMKLLAREGVPCDSCESEGTIAFVAVDGRAAGYIVIKDELKPDAVQAIKGLRSLGVEKVVMLTGDRQDVAARVAAAVGVDTYAAELLPEDKVRKVEELQASLQSRKEDRVVFVGDGINDAPVIMRADVGVAMGALGSDAAIEAADIVIMDDQPSKLVTAIAIARRTRAIVLQNIALALAVKGVFLLMGVAGVATMWEAVIGDVGVTVLAVLNSTRALRLPSVGTK